MAQFQFQIKLHFIHIFQFVWKYRKKELQCAMHLMRIEVKINNGLIRHTIDAITTP